MLRGGHVARLREFVRAPTEIARTRAMWFGQPLREMKSCRLLALVQLLHEVRYHAGTIEFVKSVNLLLIEIRKVIKSHLEEALTIHVGMLENLNNLHGILIGEDATFIDPKNTQ